MHDLFFTLLHLYAMLPLKIAVSSEKCPARRNNLGAYSMSDTLPRTVLYYGKSESFSLCFDVTCKSANVGFFWKGLITGDEQGKIVFSMKGQARSASSLRAELPGRDNWIYPGCLRS